MDKSNSRRMARQLHMAEHLEPKLPLSGDPMILDPDEAGWASVRNFTSAQFSDDFNARKDTQILIDIEVDEINGQQRVSGVWQDNIDSRGWAGHRNLTSSEFSEKWTLYHDSGYRLIDQESYTLGGTRFYAGIWIENDENYAWASYRNATSVEFGVRFDQYKDNYIMIDFEAYPVGDSTLYAAAWVENVDDLAWIERRDLTSAEFSDYFQQYQDAYRVHDIESYQINGEQRYAAIWVGNENGRGWQEWRDMTANQYQNRWVRNRDLGYRLVDFETYATDNGQRYAGVWRQNSDRPDWALRATINTLVQDHLDAFNVPGIGVAIAHQDEVKYMRGFGYQDIADDEWYSAYTVNRLASVSKAIGGVLLMELAEQGDINPEWATRSYAPELPVHQTHTLKELASNRGGVGHYSELGLGTVNTQYDTALEAAELFWDEPLLSEPGTDYHYSTHGYTLLGAGIEGATGDSISAVINEEFTVGLNLPTLRVEDRSQANSFRATLYNTNNTEATPDNISWKVLGGGLEASAYDLMRFGSKLIDGQILAPAKLDELWAVPEPDNVSYALGWSVGTQQETRVVGKDGAQRGANTYLRLFPDANLSIVVLTNRSGGGHSAGTLARDIADAILPTLPHPPGDFDGDFDIDGYDFLEWQQGYGPQYSARDLAVWKSGFGSNSTQATALNVQISDLPSISESLAVPTIAAPGAEFVSGPALVDIVLALDLVDEGANAESTALERRESLSETAHDAAMAFFDVAPSKSAADEFELHATPDPDDDGVDEPWLVDEFLERVFG